MGPGSYAKLSWNANWDSEMNQELERFEPAEAAGRIAYEHLHRYAICRERAAGQRVLDVACGAGYGTSILAEVASEAVGVDIDAAVIRRASSKYKRDNLRYVAADCTDMPFADASFDVVVANEMIEHIEDQDGFLKEAKRVLTPGGRLLVSTPNKPIYNRYKSPNPFHVAEMTIAEFGQLLKRHFAHVHLTGMRMALVSAAFDLESKRCASDEAKAKTYRGVRLLKSRPEVSNDHLRLEDPEYVLASCSDQPIGDAAQSTVFFSNDDDLWLEHEKIMGWASELHEEDEVLRANLAQARAEVEAARAAFEEQKRTNEQSDEARQHLDLSARLLSRLTGEQVEAKTISLVDALFGVNELIATQRARLEKLEKTELRLERLEREIESKRAAQELQVSQLRREYAEAREKLEREIESKRAAQELQISQLRREYAEAREKLERELQMSRAAQEAQREAHEAAEQEHADELRRSQLRLDELQRHTRKRNEERDRLTRESEQRTARLEQELNDARRALAQLGDASASGTAAGAGVQIGSADAQTSSGRSRRQSRLVASHRTILNQLGQASARVRGAIPSARAVNHSLFQRLVRRRSSARHLPFDRAWVKRQMPDAGSIGVVEILHKRQYYRVDPHPLFSAAYYLERNSDVAAAGISPYQHYLEHGWREGRDPHPYFTNDWYLQQNPDVLGAGANPLVHYLEHGWKEGRRPNPVFHPLEYAARHADVEASGLEPLTHYVMYGLAEDREIPFQGLERDWRALVESGDCKSLMDYLLSDAVRFPKEVAYKERAEPDGWPPAPPNDLSIPQALRDFMIDRNWEGLIPLYTYLYSVIDAYSEVPEDFASSIECELLMDRARTLSDERKGKMTTPAKASILIPVYNNFLDTLLCIVSLLESEPKIPFEIIVADDCSTDATAQLVPKIGGIVRHVRHAENHGFLGNCNLAADHARGDKIVLLNNDTLVLPGWLEYLLAPFDGLESVGLVGSKLISWDGRLQEAGGIFWRDGSAWNFGRGQNATDPEFNYLKDVDYCSGASIAVPATLWRELGGFDDSYAPAYCEDSDLAFRIRQAGWRTLYSPYSEVIHHEGRSHGRDTGTGIKSHQLLNQKRLVQNWKHVLERDHFRNGENVLRARDRSAKKSHILVIDHYVPQFDKDAGSRTMFQFLEALTGQGWAVTFWPENLYRDPDYTKALQEMGAEVIYGPKFLGKFSDFLRTRAGLYDAVLLSRPHVAVHFIDDVKALTDARILYYGHDVHFERLKAQHEIAGSVDEEAVESMRALELGICDRCDVILYPSEEEARLIAPLVAQNVQSFAIPAYAYGEADLENGSETAAATSVGADGPFQLLFVGGFAHGPNPDGIAWFSREVAPILRREGFEFSLQIVGSNPTAEVWDLEAEDTHVLGFVSDEKLSELYKDSSMVIAPLRFGAGVKGKVVEAMARGVPVVTTHVGAQGLKGAEEFLFLGDSAEDFAAAVRAAAEGTSARNKAEAALDYVRGHYSRQAMVKVFKKVLGSTAPFSRAA